MNKKYNLFYHSCWRERSNSFIKPQLLSTRLGTRAKESNIWASNMD